MSPTRSIARVRQPTRISSVQNVVRWVAPVTVMYLARTFIARQLRPSRASGDRWNHRLDEVRTGLRERALQLGDEFLGGGGPARRHPHAPRQRHEIERRPA